MLDKEVGEDGDGHIEARDMAESGQQPHILVHRYGGSRLIAFWIRL